MKYQEFKEKYVKKENNTFSKFQKLLFETQKMLDKINDIYQLNSFIHIIENRDLNKSETLIDVLDIYKILFIKSKLQFSNAA